MPRRNVDRSASLTSQDSCSAVIIADMVAQVEDRYDLHGEHAKHIALEHNNMAYESTLDSSPATVAVVNVDVSETVDLHHVPARNGFDMSKGIILNASHISESVLEKGVKPIELSTKEQSLEKLNTKEDELVGGFKNMSFSRKVAFVFSFLPSIMFVLCFAVILPCKEPVPCVHDLWNNVLNNTAINQLRAPGNLVYSFTNGSSHGIAVANRNNGKVLWKTEVNGEPQWMECGFIARNDSVSCLMAEVSGTLNFVNVTEGGLQKGEVTIQAPPVFLPACIKGELQPVAMSVSKTSIKMRLDGVTNILITVDCDLPPTKLKPWLHINGTSLLFLCRKGSKETLMSVPASRWCPDTEETSDDVSSIISRPAENWESSQILPIETGLLVWMEKEVLLLDKSGLPLWSEKNDQHGKNNRFVLFGNFRKSGKEFVLLSNKDNNDLQISILKSKKPDVIPVIPNAELKDVKLLDGKEKDFLLLAYNKNAEEGTLTTELSFMELDKHPQVLSPFWKRDADLLNLSVTVSKETSDSMSIFVVRQSPEEKQSEIAAISVQKWDVSASENAQCYWKA